MVTGCVKHEVQYNRHHLWRLPMMPITVSRFRSHVRLNPRGTQVYIPYSVSSYAIIIKNDDTMIKLYLKQAWTMIKQHRLFTGIYVVGTGLSIALVMTLFIIFYH